MSTKCPSKLRRKRQYINKIVNFQRKKNILRNRKAVNAVISNLILLVAVVAVGFSVLAWAQGQSADYQKSQTNLITRDINQLQERISLENVYYNASGVPSKTLNIYLMNSGTVNVTIQTVYLSSSPSNLSFTLKTFNNQVIASKTLNAASGQTEGYIEVATAQNLSGNYTATIITSRGSTFVYSFTI